MTKCDMDKISIKIGGNKFEPLEYGKAQTRICKLVLRSQNWNISLLLTSITSRLPSTKYNMDKIWKKIGGNKFEPLEHGKAWTWICKLVLRSQNWNISISLTSITSRLPSTKYNMDKISKKIGGNKFEPLEHGKAWFQIWKLVLGSQNWNISLSFTSIASRLPYNKDKISMKIKGNKFVLFVHGKAWTRICKLILKSPNRNIAVSFTSITSRLPSNKNEISLKIEGNKFEPLVHGKVLTRIGKLVLQVKKWN
jgi:hypothetical protein